MYVYVSTYLQTENRQLRYFKRGVALHKHTRTRAVFAVPNMYALLQQHKKKWMDGWMKG